MTSSTSARFAPFLIVLCLVSLSGQAVSQTSPITLQVAVSEPWYAASAIEVNPEPIIAGVPTEYCITIQNPTATAVNVDVMFFWGHFGIGLGHTPINGLRPVHLPPYSVVKECIYWIAPLQQSYSLRVELYLPTSADTIFAERNLDMVEPLQPLTSHSLVFPVGHNEATDATITLGIVPHLPDWGMAVSPDVIYNLPPSTTTMCTLTVTPPAELPGHRIPIVDVEAFVGGEIIGGFRKIFPAPLRCPGQQFNLTGEGTVLGGTSNNQERGVYITALKTFNLCAIGMEIDLPVPQILTARIYEATGNARGALLASASEVAVTSGPTYHFVPLDYSLEPCQDYNITVEFGQTYTWNYIVEPSQPAPFDVGGAIRVRDGEWNGDPSSIALPFMSIIGEARGSEKYTDLEPGGQMWNFCSTGVESRGLIIRPTETINLYELTWRADIGIDPVMLTAMVFEAPGGVRGPLMAAGDAVADQVGGMYSHSIPLSCVLREGVEYDLVVGFPPPSMFECLIESDVPMPYQAGDAFVVLDGEGGGNPADSVLVHLGAAWSPGAGGVPYDLGLSTTRYYETQPDFDYGMYVEAIVDQRLFSLGWWADVPAGAVIGARVYEAAGTTRGALISEGFIESSGGGMRWHDIPVTAELGAGAGYDFEIDIGVVNQWAYWYDTGQPYEPYGVIRVVEGEQGGNPSNVYLINMRMNACNTSATGIVDNGPARPPQFHLALPYPNPVSGVSTVDYRIDQGGPVTIAVYDVKGRLVRTLLQTTRPAGPGRTRLDAADMPAGVYFVRLSTEVKSVSRKITVVR